MNETLGILIVVFSILGFLTTAGGIVLLVMQGRKLEKLERQSRRIRVLEKALAEEKATREKDKTEVIEGQFKLAELVTQGMKANAEYLNTISKGVIDSTFDVVNKNAEDILKLSTENSQKVYDATVVMIQMMNGLMSAMGYRPSAPTSEDTGSPRQTYGQPPVEEGLTFTKY